MGLGFGQRLNGQHGPLAGRIEVGSPAIDAADNAICAAAPVSNNSQNGITRPADGDGNGTATCDIGAFERSSGFQVYLPYIVRSGNDHQ